MKKSFLLFILLSSLVFGQDIDGIGIFKINKTTTSIIDFLSKSDKYELQKCTDYMLICTSVNMNKKSILEPAKLDVMNYPMIQNEKKYFILNYEVAGIKIRSIELNFYDNILYKINIETPDILLTKALQEKYQSVNKEEKTTIHCNSIYGASQFEETRNFVVFRDDNIFSEYWREEYYDSKCKKNIDFGFKIFDKSTNKNVDELYENQRKLNREKTSKESKILLKDL